MGKVLGIREIKAVLPQRNPMLMLDRAEQVDETHWVAVKNLTINEIRNPSDVAHARIYSRVLEMCTPVHVSGSDRRKSIGMDKQRIVKEVLNL